MRISSLTSNPASRRASRPKSPSPEPPLLPSTDEASDSLAPLELIPRAKSPSPSQRSSNRSISPVGPMLPVEVVQEIENLQAQLHSLNTSYESVSASFKKVSEEITDLKRVNEQLMDENQSYEVLLGEKTLSGELLGQGVFSKTWEDSSVGGTNSTFDEIEEDDEPTILESQGSGSMASGAVAAAPSRTKAKKRQSIGLTPGLDLAAELDRAVVDQAESERIEAKQRRKHTRDKSEIGYDTEGKSFPYERPDTSQSKEL